MKRAFLAFFLLPVLCASAQDLKADPYLYDFPWPAGTSYPVLGGNGEGNTHQGDFFHSWDFTIPVGDVICAAREGVVYSVSDGRRERRGMGVLIKHEGDSYAMYGHLLRGSICVKKGERVLKGEPIGKIGPEAGGAGPHLHMHFTNGERLRTKMSGAVPAQFRGENGKGWVPRRGERCTSRLKMPARLESIRTLRRALPLVRTALKIGAFDAAAAGVRTAKAISADANKTVADLLKEFETIKVDVDETLLKEIDAAIGAGHYARANLLASFAIRECKSSEHIEAFKERLAKVKNKLSKSDKKKVRDALRARTALAQGLEADMKNNWSQARRQYSTALKYGKGTSIESTARELHMAITPRMFP